ncbi:MAG: site-2 protease family protein [Pseudomonadota bacterium]
MHELIRTELDGHAIVFQGTHWTGREQLLVDGEPLVDQRSFAYSGSIPFSLPSRGAIELSFRIDGRANRVHWTLTQNDEVLRRGSEVLSARLERQRTQLRAHRDTPAANAEPPANTSTEKETKPESHTIALVGIFFKLLKSGTALKVALAGSAFAGWSLLFSWQVAVLVIGVIVFHEYGHLRAMRRCGLATKGIYLIPFVGGVAIGNRPTSHWHDVYISMMGPVYGLYMSLAFALAYAVTRVDLFGLVASFWALVNLFNLLPVYPLDGGHVLKSVSRSLSERHSWAVLLGISALAFAASAAAGLYLLTFFSVLGAVDLLLTQLSARDDEVERMGAYGAVGSLVWMVLVMGALIAIMVFMARAGVPGSDLPLRILRD